jgi:hypothetical protein
MYGCKFLPVADSPALAIVVVVSVVMFAVADPD